MDKIYYQSNHLWKGQKAVKKLKELSGEKPKAVKQWLSPQAFWQVHLPAPKRVDRPPYQVTIPNEMHQFDLLYMPYDSLYRSKYKYILAGIDAAQALHGLAPKCKLINMHELIYKSTNDYVTLLPCENGSNVNNKA